MASSAVRECYYSLLGVDFNASPEDLKKAYRRKAIEKHPDKNPHDDLATYNFQLLQEAYECLSDPQVREQRDREAERQRREREADREKRDRETDRQKRDRETDRERRERGRQREERQRQRP